MGYSFESFKGRVCDCRIPEVESLVKFDTISDNVSFLKTFKLSELSEKQVQQLFRNGTITELGIKFSRQICKLNSSREIYISDFPEADSCNYNLSLFKIGDSIHTFNSRYFGKREHVEIPSLNNFRLVGYDDDVDTIKNELYEFIISNRITSNNLE